MGMGYLWVFQCGLRYLASAITIWHGSNEQHSHLWHSISSSLVLTQTCTSSTCANSTLPYPRTRLIQHAAVKAASSPYHTPSAPPTPRHSNGICQFQMLDFDVTTT